MEFFRLELDKRYKNPVATQIKDSQIEQLEPSVWFTKITKDVKALDFFVIQKFNRKYFLVSDRLKQLFDIYGDGYEKAVPLFATDSQQQRLEFYWNLRLKNGDYLVPRMLYSKEEPMLREEPPFPTQCFQGTDGDGEYIIVSLPLAEHILRKNWNGIRLVPIKQKGGEGL
ncbi:MAG: hypothetical protein IKL07_07325 [Clostridium sp.]|nr:hypothetical protein [Clostridium sp.]